MDSFKYEALSTKSSHGHEAQQEEEKYVDGNASRILTTSNNSVISLRDIENTTHESTGLKALLIQDRLLPSSEGETDNESETADSTLSNDELFGLNENSSWILQLKVLSTQAIPVVISFFLSIGGTFINLIFAGHYVVNNDKTVVFAGVSLANMFANVSCLSILIGMSGAVETLGSQHNGAGNYKEVGLVLQRSVLILSLICVPIMFLWYFTWDIFLMLGVERNVCIVIRNFIRIRTLAIPIDVLNESYEKYLMSIGVMQPSMWSNISFNIFILSFNLIFVFLLKLDYECLAWSWVISDYIAGMIQIGLSLKEPAVKRTLQPFSRQALAQWGEFLLLGLPGTVMLCSEWWAYEILTLFASQLGTAPVAAQTIVLQTASLAFMIPLGLGVASTSLVGNSLGANHRQLAINIGKLSLLSIGFVELIISAVIFFSGEYFVDLFTNDNIVKLHANHAIPFLALFTMIDGFQGVASGVLRGAGKQFIGAITNVISFYVIGLPTAWLLCFRTSLRFSGLMLGIALGTCFQVFVLLILILRFESYVFTTNIAHQKISSSSVLIDEFDDLYITDEEESIGSDRNCKSASSISLTKLIGRNTNIVGIKNVQ
eukprot:gene16448-22431_t